MTVKVCLASSLLLGEKNIEIKPWKLKFASKTLSEMFWKKTVFDFWASLLIIRVIIRKKLN